jgi:hypothetical protein
MRSCAGIVRNVNYAQTAEYVLNMPIRVPLVARSRLVVAANGRPSDTRIEEIARPSTFQGGLSHLVTHPALEDPAVVERRLDRVRRARAIEALRRRDRRPCQIWHRGAREIELSFENDRIGPRVPELISDVPQCP